MCCPLTWLRATWAWLRPTCVGLSLVRAEGSGAASSATARFSVSRDSLPPPSRRVRAVHCFPDQKRWPLARSGSGYHPDSAKPIEGTSSSVTTHTLGPSQSASRPSGSSQIVDIATGSGHGSSRSARPFSTIATTVASGSATDRRPDRHLALQATNTLLGGGAGDRVGVSGPPIGHQRHG